MVLENILSNMTNNEIVRYKNIDSDYQKFFRWLKNHNCYGQFVNNFKIQKGNSFPYLKVLLEEIIDNYGCHSIDYSFHWAITQEGHNFWGDLHHLCCNELYTILKRRR